LFIGDVRTKLQKIDSPSCLSVRTHIFKKS